MVLIKDIIRRSTLSSGAIGNCCAGTFFLSRAYMHLSQPKSFIGCDMGLAGVFSRLSQWALVFAWQALNKKSDITADEDLQQANFTFVYAMEELYLKRLIDVQEVTADFRLCKLFSCIYSIIFQHITCNIFFTIKCKTFQRTIGHIICIFD